MKKILLFFIIIMLSCSGCVRIGSGETTSPTPNTTSSEEKEINSCLKKADELIQNGRYGEAMSLLKEEWRKNKDSAIDAKICEMYDNNQIEDVTTTFEHPMCTENIIGVDYPITDFDCMLHVSYADGQSFDCYDYNEGELIYEFIKGYGSWYFDHRENFDWDLTYSNFNSIGEQRYVPEQQMDWILENFFNVKPSHSLNWSVGEYGKIYYSNGFYYYESEMSSGGGKLGQKADYNFIYSLGDNQYYFSYTCNICIDGAIYNYGTKTRYAVLEQKTVDGITFWSMIKTSDQPISLKELWEKQKENM